MVSTSLNGFSNVLKFDYANDWFKERRRIVTLSLSMRSMGNRGQVNYSAAKAGLIGATELPFGRLAKRKITVNCMLQGLIETEMVTKK